MLTLEKELLLNLAFLAKSILFSPNSVFMNIKNGKFVKEVYIIFCTSVFITFLKSFLSKKNVIIFFEGETINSILSLLSIPQIAWVLMYICYFFFLFCLFMVCNHLNKQAKFKPLAIGMMSISTIGIIAQILFFIVKFVFPKQVIVISSYLVYFWVVLLSLLAIKITQNISFKKAFVCFFVSIIPFIVFVMPLGIFPYLAWFSR